MTDNTLIPFARPHPLSRVERLLHGYRLATAEIFYRMPDYPDFLQTFIWQELDLSPEYPILHRFLNFWHRNLDGKLHSVTVASSGLTMAGEIRVTEGDIRIH